MKILHLPESFLPSQVGGKEIYCLTLANALTSLGAQNLVAIHQPTELHAKSYSVHGCDVKMLPPLPYDNARRIQYERTFESVPGFLKLLEDFQPDIVHFHDQNGGASLSHLRLANAQRIPTVLTYHSPGQTCPQTELLRFGRIPCDGKVDLFRCTNCRLQSTGVSKVLAPMLALASPPGISGASKSKLARALSARRMTSRFADSLQEFSEKTTAIVTLAKWCRDVWIRNGVPAEKIHLIETGGRDGWKKEIPPRFPYRTPRTLRLACLGRCTEIKGFHVLVNAVKSLPHDVDVEISFFGPQWTDDYGQSLKGSISNDRRFLPPKLVANEELLTALVEMDAVVIPSLWLETGPLTLFDAFAARLPVIGSQLGGIAERVTHGTNGFLFTPGNSSELAQIIESLFHNPSRLAAVAKKVPTARTILDAATEYLDLYRRVITRT